MRDWPQVPQNLDTVSPQPIICVIIHSTKVYSGLRAYCVHSPMCWTSGSLPAPTLLGYDFLLQITPKVCRLS